MLTKSAIQIDVERNSGAALASKAEQEANQIVALAKANATKVRLEGEAEASMQTNVGLAKAQAIDAQVKAYGGAEYRVIQEIADKLSDAIKNAKVDIVPKTIVNMGGAGNSDNGGNGTIIDALLKFITVEKLGISLKQPETEIEVSAAETPAAPVETAPPAAAAPETKMV